VLEKFFDLIYPIARHDLSQAVIYHHVIRLARKWHCVYALEILYNAVKLSVADRGFTNPPDYLFIIAVGLEDTSLLKLVISECSTQTWDHTWTDLDYEAKGLPDRCFTLHHPQYSILFPRAFEFGAWTLDHYLTIPPHIIWCMLRARRASQGNDWHTNVHWLTRYISRLCEFDSATCVVDGANRTVVDTRKIGVGPRTLSELAALRQQYKPYPRAELSFSFEETWRETVESELDTPRSRIEKFAFYSRPTLSTRHHYDDGDIVIVSSDNVSFRVDSIILRRASSVQYPDILYTMLIYV